MFETILPHNSTPFEFNLEKAGTHADLPVDRLAMLSDPWTIDARYLPWLAYRFSIEIWNDDWSEEKKRSVIARAIELQRIKGTEKGLRDYVALADAEVKQVVVPPQHFWAAKGLTKDEIDTWHRTMPQIRVYFSNERRNAKGFSFVGHFANHMIATPDMGRALYGRKARLWDDGAEIPLNLIEIKETDVTGKAVMAERVSLPGKAGRTFFAGGFVDVSSCEAVIKEPQLVTWNKDITYSYQSMDVSTTSLRPSLKPVDLRSEQVSDHWTDDYSFTSSRIANRFFAVPNKAQEKLYDRIILNDPKRAAPKIKGLSFTNVNMLGMPSFTARVLIDLKEKRQGKTFFADDGVANAHVSAPDNQEKQKSVDRAATLSKSVRDRIFASYQTSRPITFGDLIPLDGSIRFNTRVENRL